VTVEALSVQVLATFRRRFLWKRPVFLRYSAASLDGLRSVQKEIGAELPAQLMEWLLLVGYGDLGEDLSFRQEWFMRVSSGELTGAVIFAQDILGSFYAFDASGRIYYFPRTESAYAFVSKDFLSFMEELVQRNYELVEWMDTLPTDAYDW